MGQKQLFFLLEIYKKEDNFQHDPRLFQIKFVTLWLPARDFLSKEYAGEDKSSCYQGMENPCQEKAHQPVTGCQHKYFGLRKTTFQSNKNPGDICFF